MDNKSIGFILKEARLARQLSLEQASKDTKIHVNILKSIEADDFSSLGAVYAKSFLKIYAEYLGLNKEEVVPGSKNLQGPVEARPGRQAQFSADTDRGCGVLAQTFIGVFRKVNFRQVAILFLVIILLTGLTKFIKYRKREQSVAKKAEAVKQDIKKPQVPAKSSVPLAAKNTVAPKPKRDAVSAREKMVLTIKAKNRNWLQVKIDGKIVFQGILAKSSSETWSASDRFELWVGDAGALVLEFNGQILDRIGRPGQTLKYVLLTRSGLSIKR
ncbi:MAG TPA: hypothetical protein DCL35_05245 [Candidatus Omnitrophica bacterium]|nr:hypothetical protein [Candidatus Omnitrophota bacterium]